MKRELYRQSIIDINWKYRQDKNKVIGINIISNNVKITVYPNENSAHTQLMLLTGKPIGRPKDKIRKS